MRNWSILPVILFFLAGCRSVPEYNSYLFNDHYPHRAMPYLLSRDGNDRMLAVLLNDNPDTFNLANSPLVRELSNRNYAILIPGKPGETPLDKHSMDAKDVRTEDISYLIRSLRSDFDHVLIIGIGEGGYLIPGISGNALIDRAFLVNVSPQGRLHEMKEILKDTLSFKKTELIKRQHAYNEKELLDRIRVIRETESDIEQIAPGTNRYWRSYENTTLLDEFPLMEPPADWIVFKRYPFLTDKSRKMAHLICDALPEHTYAELPGKGNLNKKEDMQVLTDYILSRLNTKH